MKEGTRIRITCRDGEEIEATLVRDLDWCPKWARLLIGGTHCVVEHERIVSVEALS